MILRSLCVSIVTVAALCVPEQKVSDASIEDHGKYETMCGEVHVK